MANGIKTVGCWEAPCLLINTKSGYVYPSSRRSENTINIGETHEKNTKCKQMEIFDSKKEVISENNLL